MPVFCVLFFCLAGMLVAQEQGPPEVAGKPVDGVTLRYIDMVKGTGAPAVPNKQYTVHYTGWLASGKKFDSSLDRKEPLTFVQGRKQVITGWDIGFEGMNVGGKRRLFIPPQLAYADRATGSIPPKSELIFDVELLDVKDAIDLPAAVDVLVPFGDLEAKVMALAKAVPEEKYSWRPGPGVRSFGDVFRHIANGNHLILEIAVKQPDRGALEKLIAENETGEKKPSTKAETLQLLADSFAAVRKSMEGSRAGMLAHDADFFGQHTTRKGVLTILDTHIAEHLGQAIAYARMNGITPPWSQGTR
jgi:uncharacterized damage-inducible protein DinB